METKESTFSEWIDTLSMTDFSNIAMLILFTILIIAFVLRTFRNKPSA